MQRIKNPSMFGGFFLAEVIRQKRIVTILGQINFCTKNGSNFSFDSLFELFRDFKPSVVRRRRRPFEVVDLHKRSRQSGIVFAHF